MLVKLEPNRARLLRCSPLVRHFILAILTAERKAPVVDLTTANSASSCKFVSLGKAMVARIPKMTMTNSMSMKPL
jgi:hypothetical protein